MWAIAKYIIDNAVSGVVSGVRSMLGTADSTGGSVTDGDVMAKLNAAITNTVADQTADKAGTLSQKHAYTHSMLENGAYGLNALKTAVNSVTASPKVVKSVQRGITGSGVQISNPLTINISSINPNKSFVQFAGKYTAAINDRMPVQPCLQELTATTLVIVPARLINTTGNETLVSTSWQVTEFY